MAKSKSIYTCTECGATNPKWQGQCPGCGEWNTLVETVAEKATGHRFESLAPPSKLQSLHDIEARRRERIPTGISEFDRALGGGLVAGGVVPSSAATRASARARCSCNPCPACRRGTWCSM